MPRRVVFDERLTFRVAPNVGGWSCVTAPGSGAVLSSHFDRAVPGWPQTFWRPQAASRISAVAPGSNVGVTFHPRMRREKLSITACR